MKALSDEHIARFVAKYPVLAEPVNILRQRQANGHGVALGIHVGVKRMDVLTPYFVGYPTSRGTWIVGEGNTEGLEGVEECRAYRCWPTTREALDFLYEWFDGDHERLGNLLRGMKSFDEIAHIVIEQCRLWYEPRTSLRWERVAGRTSLRAIEARFIILLPPKEGSLDELFRRASKEPPATLRDADGPEAYRRHARAMQDIFF